MFDILCIEPSKIKVLTIVKGLKIALLAGGNSRLGKHM